MLLDMLNRLLPDKDRFGQSNYANVVYTLVIIFLVLFLQLAIGKYLWNNAAVPLVSVLKPCKNSAEILGLSLLIMLLSPS